LILAKVDDVWDKDWIQVIDLLLQAHQTDPGNQTVTDKLYVAYYNYGQSLLGQAKKSEAIQQFQAALGVKADGIEAKQALLSLTPTATATNTRIPTATATATHTPTPTATATPAPTPEKDEPDSRPGPQPRPTR
jgi:hypothetical protein